METKLSIIVPVYQAESYLRKCIDSILNQTMSDFELILIDDGSKDRSGEICDEYALQDKRIRVIHKNNEGQATARNNGITAAQGQYIGFVDNDDMIRPDMFELLVHNIENINADISACSFIQENEDGTIVSKNHTSKKMILSNREGVKEFLTRTKLDIYIWTKIYRKSFLENHAIRFEAGKTDEDFLFNFEAFKHAKLTIVEDVPKYIYFHRESSASRIYPKEHLEKYLNMTLYRLDKILHETKKVYPEFTDLANSQKIKYCFIMLRTITQTGKSTCELQYKQILHFLKKNTKQMYRERKIIGNTTIGIALLYILPADLYYRYRRIKDGLIK